MKKISVKQRMQEIKFTTENHLSSDQLKQLIANKTDRARQYQETLKQREVKVKYFDL